MLRQNLFLLWIFSTYLLCYILSKVFFKFSHVLQFSNKNGTILSYLQVSWWFVTALVPTCHWFTASPSFHCFVGKGQLNHAILPFLCWERGIFFCCWRLGGGCWRQWRWGRIWGGVGVLSIYFIKCPTLFNTLNGVSICFKGENCHRVPQSYVKPLCKSLRYKIS